ncbi:hypothetical protein ACIBG7_27185 [Nonomuraea sp. NPDC050328]|uniref:hypothetical protein n=1 Tax=Nonomuraea sp. NPDC050328 TaxID=3364361 RepID=UPI0037A910D6
MGRLGNLIIIHAVDADYELGEALIRVNAIQEEGTLDDHALGKVADLYHLRSWWQEVTDLTHGREESVDGGAALLAVRHNAEQYLILLPARTHASAFALAMAESRRAAAQKFLHATRPLADALTLPPARANRPADNPPASRAAAAGVVRAAREDAAGRYRP